MILSRILLWSGKSLVCVAVLMVLTGLLGLMASEPSMGVLFLVLAVVTGLAGGLLFALTMHVPSRGSRTEALAFLLLFWIGLPAVMAVPYVASGAAPLFGAAYFEAVSAFTTTGASTLDPDALPRSLHVWRSLLQWGGGVAAATFAVVMLAALNLQGTGVHRSIMFTLKAGDLLERLGAVGRIIAVLYSVAAFVCFIGLLVTGTEVFDAFCLSLTAVSTGGLTPRGGVVADYVPSFGGIILAGACMFGAMNIAVIWDVVRQRRAGNIKPLFRNVEHRALIVLAGVVFVGAALFTAFRHLFTLFLESVFFVTSAGFDWHVIGIDTVPPVILISLALIGGSALSTAGGVKLIRLLLLFRHLETDLSRLTHPSRIVPVTFRGQIIPDKAFLSVWMYFFGYTMVLALGIMAMAAVGLDFPMAVTATAATLSNMGPLMDATLPLSGYESFTPAQQSVSVCLMLIGRVEVLAVMAAFTPGLWQS